MPSNSRLATRVAAEALASVINKNPGAFSNSEMVEALRVLADQIEQTYLRASVPRDR